MDSVGCATRKVSLRVVHMIWAGGCCGGVLLRHWLGERVFYTKGMDIFRNFVRYEKDTGNIQTVE